MASGIKFGCLCAKTYPADPLPEEPVDIGYGFLASGKMPYVDMDLWTRWLGTNQIGAMKEANLWVWVEMDSDNVEIADEEDNSLFERMSTYWWGLLFQEPPRIDIAWLFTGNKPDGKHNIRRVSLLERVVKHQSTQTRVNLGMLREAATTAAGYEEIIRYGGLRGRLNLGFHAFGMGLSSRYLEGGFLAFERALEGVLQPTSSGEFVDRGKEVIEVPSGHNEIEMLKDIYRMRNKLTHCLGIAVAFPNLPKQEADKRAIELFNVTYKLAARIYRKILRDKKLADFLMKDDLGAYWDEVVQGRREPPFEIELHPEDWKTGGG